MLSLVASFCNLAIQSQNLDKHPRVWEAGKLRQGGRTRLRMEEGPPRGFWSSNRSLGGNVGLPEEHSILVTGCFSKASRAGPRISSSRRRSNGSQNQGHMTHSTHTHLHQDSGSWHLAFLLQLDEKNLTTSCPREWLPFRVCRRHSVNACCILLVPKSFSFLSYSILADSNNSKYSWPLNNTGVRGTDTSSSPKFACNFDSPKPELQTGCLWSEAWLITHTVDQGIFCMLHVLYVIVLQSSKLTKRKY